MKEFRASFDNENRIPNHGFESMLDIFSILKIENSVLEISSFRVIATNTETTNNLLKYFFKFKSYYPNLYERSSILSEKNTFSFADV